MFRRRGDSLWAAQDQKRDIRCPEQGTVWVHLPATAGIKGGPGGERHAQKMSNMVYYKKKRLGEKNIFYFIHVYRKSCISISLIFNKFKTLIECEDLTESQKCVSKTHKLYKVPTCSISRKFYHFCAQKSLGNNDETIHFMINNCNAILC